MKIPSFSCAVGALAALFLGPVGIVRAQLSDGLLNYWNFEGNFNDSAGAHPGSASTTADNGINIAGNVTFVGDGPLGAHGSFAGDFVEVPNSEDVIAAGESLSISAWFRVEGFNQDWQALIAHGEGSDYRIARRGGDSVMAYAGGTVDIPGGALGPVVSDGAWHHVVAISEAGVSTRLWVDGGLVATGGAPNLTNNGAARMMIGGNPDTGSPYRAWNGGIDDVGMWNRALTPQEIAFIHDGGLAGDSLATLFNPDDDDGDGLPNVWELANGLDPDDNGLNPNNNGVAGNPDNGAGGDPDADGSTNAEELAATTNPRNPDTDGDGLNDGEEVALGTSPRNSDSDQDGLNDGAEIALGTDPLNRDTDGDGVQDGIEVAGGTDPLVPDDPSARFGLIAYWPLDSDLANAHVNDYHGAEDGGAIPFEAGQFDGAIRLDGSQSVIIGGDENVMDFAGGNMTVSAWCTVDTIDTDWQCLVAKGEGNGWRMHRRGGDAPPEMSWTGGNGDIPRHGIPFVVGTDPETWHHFAGVTDSATQTQILYMDGVEVARSAGAVLENRGNPMRIGENPDALNRRWKGKIDDLAVWARALSADEIAGIWNGGEGASITDLLGGGGLGFRITEILHNTATDEITLTWTSKPGRIYGIYWGTDLSGFGADINDSIPADAGERTTYTFDHPLPGAPELFFRVQQN